MYLRDTLGLPVILDTPGSGAAHLILSSRKTLSAASSTLSTNSAPGDETHRPALRKNGPLAVRTIRE